MPSIDYTSSIRVSVLDKKTGKETGYPSIKAAADALHLNYNTVIHCSKVGRECQGYMFRRLNVL